MPPTFLRTAEWKQQLSGKNIQEEVEGALQGQQRGSKDLWFLLGKKKKVQKSETKRRYIRIEKGGYHVSDQTLLLTAKMVNSCKSKDHREGKKDSKPS